MPKQLIVTEPRKTELREYGEERPGDGEVLVRVNYASPKHGTDLGDFRGTSPFLGERFDETLRLFVPREPGSAPGVAYGSWNVGNMWVGRIEAVGKNVTEYRVGERVCSYGGIRETHVVRGVDNFRLRKLPEDASWKNAVCYDPAQFALGGVRDSKVGPGDAVAVFGLGAIGLLAVQMYLRMGAGPVFAVDPIEKRRKVAERAGAVALDPVGADLGLRFKQETKGRGVDAVLETSGSPHALQSALRGLAYGGTIAYVAFGKEFKGGLDFGKEAHFNYARIVFSRAGSEPNPDYPRWSRRRIEDTVWDMLTTGFLDCEDIVDPVVPFAECAEAYMKYVDREPEAAIKLGVAL